MFTLLSFCESSAEIWQLVGKIINIIKIVIPIIIVILAMLDLGKAVMAGEEKEIKEAQKMLIKRSVVEDDAACWACATSPSGQVCKDAVNKAQNQ